MNLYTLNTGFQLDIPIDDFQSLVWTERYNNEGDFNLVVRDTVANRAIFKEGTFLGLGSSKEVMIIDTPLAEDGLLTLTGVSLMGFLRERIARDTWYNGYTYWVLTGTPGAIAGEIVKQMCMSGAGNLMANDYVVTGGASEVIPNLKLGDIASGTSVELAIEYGTVYDAVKTVCDSYELGFTLYPDNITDATYDLFFKTYAGRNLTSSQSTYPVVRFEPAMDSLSDVSELRSIAGFKNVCYAWAPNIEAQLYIVGKATAPGVTGSTVGFNRRTMMLTVDDINAADFGSDPQALKLKAYLNARARDALANNNYVRVIDGEIVPQSGYEYGVDYMLGDIIELRTELGVSSTARVTEYIQTKDERGEKSYPTLSVITE